MGTKRANDFIINQKRFDKERVGFQVKVCDPNEFKRYKCPLCEYLMRDPIQTTRGELACQYCYNQARRDDSKCPIDNDPIEGHEFRDKGKEKDILRLKCFCSYGCSWTGKVSEVENHLRECEFIPMECQLCHQEFPQSNLNSHLEICSELLRTKSCLYKGCTHKPENIEELRHHLHSQVVLHAYLHSSAIIDMQEEIKQQSVDFKNTLKESEAKVSAEMETMKEHIAFLMKTATENKAKSDTLNKKLEEKINKLEENISGNIARNTDSSTNATNTDVERLSGEINALNKTFSDLDLRQQLFENTNYNGKLVWKIDNIKTRLKQAQDGKITALHSAPTFTQRNEYKFCSRLYLNGDGVGKGSHVSLFFVLMKSEYDNLLQWPFSKQVKFRLINQVDQSKNITEVFMPDRTSSSFAKPKKDMNIASGCPKFIKVDKFQRNGFVVEDCIFIEVEVTNNVVPLH